MSNKLIISAAGAGKTTFLVTEALKIKDKRVLITTYTEANELEIQKKFIEINRFVPKNVTIQTWFSFLLENGVRPFQSYLYEDKIEGLLLVNSKSGVKFRTKAAIGYYPETEVMGHYFSPSSLIFSDKLSKFVVKCNAKNNDVIERLSKIYSHIFIDEVQDLAGYDLDLINLFFESNIQIILVGDPRQVTYLTHHESRLSQYANGLIKEYVVKECKKGICEIDEKILVKSHRNNQLICDFSTKLYPNFEATSSAQTMVTEHEGIFLVKPSQVEGYLSKYLPVQLRYNVKTEVNQSYQVRNYGESKGLTFDRVLIYPTESIVKYLIDGELTKTKKLKTKKGVKEEVVDAFDIAKFYVALTRAKHSVGIVCNYKDTEQYLEGLKKYE